MSYRVICALGDSITDGYWDEEGLGWFGRLTMKLGKAYPYQFGFNNIAVSGDTTADVLRRLRQEAPSRDPDILLIACGVNDVVRYDRKDNVAEVTADERQKLWRELLAEAKSLTGDVVVLSILPVDEAGMPSNGPGGRLYWNLNDDIKAYNKELKQWCEEAAVPFIDVNKTWQAHDVAGLLHDPTHPNTKGHQLVCDQVFVELERLGVTSSA